MVAYKEPFFIVQFFLSGIKLTSDAPPANPEKNTINTFAASAVSPILSIPEICQADRERIFPINYNSFLERHGLKELIYKRLAYI